MIVPLNRVSTLGKLSTVEIVANLCFLCYDSFIIVEHTMFAGGECDDPGRTRQI